MQSEVRTFYLLFFVYDNLYNNYMSHLLPLPLMVLIISMLKFVFKKLNVLYGVKLCILMPKISLFYKLFYVQFKSNLLLLYIRLLVC